MKQFFKDFKEFAMRGNVVDMAVGVVIGTAFGKIVSSLVSDIIMPALSLITGRVSLQDLSFTLPTGEGMEPIVLKYGVFLQSVLDFLIIAFSIFVVIKLITQKEKRGSSRGSSCSNKRRSFADRNQRFTCSTKVICNSQ